MYKVIVFLVMLYASFGLSLAPKPEPSPITSVNQSVAEKARLSTHQIKMKNLSDYRGCSATAVAPHTLLTATHCEVATDVVEIDGKDAHILQIVRDGDDHSLFVVDVTFKDFAMIVAHTPVKNEPVFNFGNPGSSVNVYRVGSYMHDGVFNGDDGKDRKTYMFQLPVFHGDSGSAIFDKDGNIIGVVSLGDQSAVGTSFVMGFEDAQMKKVDVKWTCQDNCVSLSK